MATSQPPPGARPSSINGHVAEAVTRLTGDVVVPRRVTGTTPSPLPPAPPVPLPAPDEPVPSPIPMGPLDGPLPDNDTELLQAILTELRGQGDRLSDFQQDMRAMRQVLAGPFRFLTFAPAAVGLTTPFAIAASGRQSLVVQQSFPGSILSLMVMTSARTARIVPTFDGTQSAINVDQLVTFNVNQAISPGGMSIQADVANNRFTTVLNTGTPEGLAFFSSFSLELENTGTASIDLLDFLVVMRRYVPLALFPTLTALEPT